MKRILDNCISQVLLTVYAFLLLTSGGCPRTGAGPDAATDVTPGAPVPVCHLLVCCRVGANLGTSFLVNGEWNPAHDYRDIGQVRDILQKVKDAGIRVVSVDFTNPNEWEMGEEGPLHMDGADQDWDQFKPMLDNIARVCNEKGMEYLIFIGDPQYWTMGYWNTVAGFIWENYAQGPSYRRYGFGDDRPLLVSFLPGDTFWPLWERTPEEERDNLARFRIGTCQINDPVTPSLSDGWGYRNMSESSDGAVRFCCPNSGVPPQDWARVDATEWRRRVKWALGASEYAVFGSYDNTCDATMWGICDVSRSTKPSHVNPSTVAMPSVYYDILRDELTRSLN